MAPLEIVYEVPPGLYQRAFRAYLWRKVGGFAIGAALAGCGGGFDTAN